MDIGAIKINKIIKFQFWLFLSSLIFAVSVSYQVFLFHHNGHTITSTTTIVDIARVYPSSVVFRIGACFTCFLIIMEVVFIRWWLD